MQTGRTLGKNNFEVVLNGSYGKYSQNSLFDKDADLDNKPVIGINCKFGVCDNFDLGISVEQNSFVGPNMKYQFLGDKESKFASAVGLNVGFNFGAFLFGDLTYYATMPLYLSYHPTKTISVYLAPRYLFTSEYVFAHPTGGSLGTKESINRIGNSLGLIIGNRNKIGLEVSSFGTDFLLPTQVSLGYIYIFGQRKK